MSSGDEWSPRFGFRDEQELKRGEIRYGQTGVEGNDNHPKTADEAKEEFPVEIQVC